MNISNRALVLLLLVTLVLVGGAAALTVGLSMKDAQGTVVVPTTDVSVVPDVVRKGGKPIDPKGPLVIEIAKGTTASSAMLQCDMYKSERPFFEGGMAFESIPFGDCRILLSGSTVPYSPVYPGDRLICAAVNGTTECQGGIAAERAGTVSVHSVAGGDVKVDGVDQGAAPLTDMKMRVGKREVVVALPDGRTMTWNLVVQPEELITVSFPAPPGWTPPPVAGAAFAPAVVPTAAPPVEAPAAAPASVEAPAAAAAPVEAPAAPPPAPQ